MTIQENFTAVQADLAAALKDAGRAPDSLSLIAVSKMQPEDRVDEALKLGHRRFGENRVQDALERWGPRKPLYPDLVLHLIGSLQTNKVGDAVALFDVIESLDRPSLAQELAKEMAKQGRMIQCLIQVNTGGEEQKGGVSPGDLEGLLTLSRDLGLNVTGLMCIPPVDEPAALHFALLRKLGQRHGLTQLSMGMSHDYKQAIPLGATSVRIGTALFGDRI